MNLLCPSFQQPDLGALQLSVFRHSFSSFLFTTCHALEKLTPQGNPGSCSIAGVVRKREEEGEKSVQGWSLTIPNLPRCQHHSSSTWAHTQLEPGANFQVPSPFPCSQTLLSSWERQRPWARAAFDRRPRLLIHSSTSLNFSGGKQGCFA